MKLVAKKGGEAVERLVRISEISGKKGGDAGEELVRISENLW